MKETELPDHLLDSIAKLVVIHGLNPNDTEYLHRCITKLCQIAYTEGQSAAIRLLTARMEALS